jgi:ribA/ribD-fused uncharacterized protein
MVTIAEAPLPPIRGFTGKHRFLSNFTPAKVWLDDVPYVSVEHAYQAAKTLDPQERAIVRNAPTPGKAKRMGRMVKIREDWERVKVGVMFGLVMQKFAIHELREMLLMTDGQLLVEDNDWGDRFWGVCDGEGQNWLGRILMGVREAQLLWNAHEEGLVR